MLKIQEYLRNGKTPENLQEEFGIKYKSHDTYPNLIGFKYHQLDSPKGEKIVQEARGIILDSSRDWEIVAYPFERFFNHGEGFAADIDWDNASITEKYDGSLCICYLFAKRWHVATSGNPSASGPVCKDYSGKWQIGKESLPKPKSFAEYFWQVMFYKYSFPFDLPKHCCYMFELVGPLNRIVVDYKEPQLVILGGRDLKTYNELSAEQVGEYFPGLPVIKQFSLSNIDEIMESFKEMSPISQEGYVVVDKHFNRIKVKSPAYVALHHAKDSFTLKTIVTIAVTGETSEVISAFPEYKADLEDAESRIENLVSELEQEYEKIKDLESQKQFAIKAVATRCSAALFQFRSGKVSSIREHLTKMHIDKLLSLLEY